MKQPYPRATSLIKGLIAELIVSREKYLSLYPTQVIIDQLPMSYVYEGKMTTVVYNEKHKRLVIDGDESYSWIGRSLRLDSKVRGRSYRYGGLVVFHHQPEHYTSSGHGPTDAYLEVFRELCKQDPYYQYLLAWYNDPISMFKWISYKGVTLIPMLTVGIDLFEFVLKPVTKDTNPRAWLNYSNDDPLSVLTGKAIIPKEYEEDFHHLLEQIKIDADVGIQLLESRHVLQSYIILTYPLYNTAYLVEPFNP